MAEEEGDPGRHQRQRQRRGLLKMYYGVGEEGDKSAAIDPCDINGAHFKPEVYLERLFKEKSLTDLMDKEGDVSKQIRALDSDMQTLVYENYNKFISATDTIRKMKHDFKKMEDEMDKLAVNMSAITEFSEKISGTLQDKRLQITKLSGVHSLLKKLQFLFELPSRLNKCVEMKQYGLAVRYYTKARDVLHQYSHMPSFSGIHEDCAEIVKELVVRLREQLRNPKSSPKQLAECVDLLLQLQEPADELCDEFLEHAREKLNEDLRVLREQTDLKAMELASLKEAREESQEAKHPRPMDLLEFVDCGCNGFLSTVGLVIASYMEQFVGRQEKDTQFYSSTSNTEGQDEEELDKVVSKKLTSFMQSLMGQYFSIVESRIEQETETGNNVLLVRSLDRFHRRLQSVHKLLPDIGCGRLGTNIVARASHNRIKGYTQSLKQHFEVCLTDTRQSLAALPRQSGKDKTHVLSDLLSNMSTSIVDQLKTVLSNLKAFIGPDVTFAVKPYFRGPFCADDVRQGLVVELLRYILSTAKGFCDGVSTVPPPLVLLLSRMCTDFQESTITYVLSLTDEQFPVDEEMQRGCVRTPVSELTLEARTIAQSLLNHYVTSQGLIISQMIRKSVETRDWMNSIEPRNVRAVMKRLVEDVTAIDTQVGQLYEEGVRKAHSSDSSKFTYTNQSKQTRAQWSYTPSTGFDSSLLSNIQKLFSEKIEIFSAVEFSKVSVLTGIIKIALKTLLECMRLRTFGKFGLQQIQVDSHYLQLYLWRFVSDENLVHFLLDEVVNSAVNRCVDPELMEASVVDVICERG
ncbi:vacuolar protein sorting-associated protein 51 homolog isoform X2 [Nematostella vectensis]|uniref:vacuolar protein sorting-associated protein 51 homolog isoform X2 n=1 Tax=Nematostella vectensis TaxID=45351 RepID=UPI0020777FF2|nr:vacuolar protein sorting-associated protein 51 homolog isoform X2 [Nematostella vectensis]